MENYEKYVKNMETKGYIRNQICLDETNKRLVTLSSVNKECDYGAFIDIRCPSGWIISVYGINQLPKNVDLRMAHSLKVGIYDNDGNEIDLSTKIKITRERVTEAMMIVGKVLYSDINVKNPIGIEPEFKTDNEWYRFAQSFELKNEDHLVMYAIKPNVNIIADKIKFALDLDMWECP